MSKSKYYDKDGNRLVPYKTCHKNIRNTSNQYKDKNGFWILVRNAHSLNKKKKDK